MHLVKKTIFDKNLEVYKHYSKNINSPVVIFCHGIAATHDNFDPLLPYLGKYAFYQFTLPAHNDLPFNKKEINVNGYANKIYKWILSKKFKKVILIGHSMGGAIMAKVSTLLKSEIVQGLILVSPYNIKCANLKSALAMNMFLNVHFLKKYIERYEKESKNFQSELNLHDNAKNFVNFVEHNKKQMNRLIINLSGIKSLNDSSSCYKNLKVKTYLILAKNDVIVPCNPTQKYLKKIIPNLEIILFENTTHILPIEIPKKFMTTINKIIKDLNKISKKSKE